jgi:hypothetical protein
MTPATARHLNVRRRSAASRLFVLAIALTFVLQSYLTQTHIHGASHHADHLTAAAVTKALKDGKAPVDGGRSDCSLCQAIAHSGVFVSASTSLLPLPLFWVMAVAPYVSAHAGLEAPAHDWQSRAPPLR